MAAQYSAAIKNLRNLLISIKSSTFYETNNIFTSQNLLILDAYFFPNLF